MINTIKKNREFAKEIGAIPLWEVSLLALIMYAFFFQYGVKTVKNAMPALSVICIIFAVFNLFYRKFKTSGSTYFGIQLFVMISILFGIVFGTSSSTVLDTGIRMLEYSLTGFSIVLFSISNKKNYDRIIFYIWFSILLLAISVITKGTIVGYMGAIGIEALNTNEMSSFFILMIFCTFYLYGKAKKKSWKTLLWLSLVIIFIIQIRAASRRGFIVMVFMIVFNIIYNVIPYNNAKNSGKRVIVYSLLIIAGAVVFIKLQDYLLNGTILGERLIGNMTGGDLARVRYHEFALEQFYSSPIFGVGIGGISFLQGVYSHSLYFEVLSCTGLVGSAILFFAFFDIFIKTLLLIKVDRVNENNLKLYINKVIFTYEISLLISGIAVVLIYDFYFYISMAVIASGLLLPDLKND